MEAWPPLTVARRAPCAEVPHHPAFRCARISVKAMSSGMKAKPTLRATRPGRRGLICFAPAALMGFGPFAGLFPPEVNRCFHQPGPACRWLQPLFPIIFIGPAAAQKHQMDWRRRASGATWLPGLSFRWSVSGAPGRQGLRGGAGSFPAVGFFLLQGCRNVTGAAPARRRMDHSTRFTGPWLV